MRAILKDRTQSQCASVPVAIYTRVSTTSQVGGRFDSCESQAAICREYVTKHLDQGWYEVACFTDAAYSGATMNRPGIQALKAQIERGLVKIVLIFKLERIGEIIRPLESKSITVVSSRDLILRPRFGEVHELLRRHFEQDGAFRAVLAADVEDYIARKKRRREFRGAHTEAARHSIDYILEELAIFALLVEDGVSVQIYPGQHLKVLVELANKRLFTPVASLNRLVCIDVSVTR